MYESMHDKLRHLSLNAFHRKLRENMAGHMNISNVWPAATWQLRAAVGTQLVSRKGKAVYDFGL